MNRRIITVKLSILPATIFFLAGVCHAKIYIKSMPLGLIRPDKITIAENTDILQKIALEWVGDSYGAAPPNCEIRYSASPGIQTSDYDLGPIPQSSQGKLTLFIPGAAGMTGGVYYCIVTETGNPGNRSDEFVLYVESLTLPPLIEPANHSYISNSTPRFVWNKVTGVPYYFIMVTDQQIIIGTDPWTGNITITTSDGLPIIPVWQAITSENSLMYGTPDPSGYFKGNPEPLLGNTTYTWIVYNCFANNPSYISSIATGANDFILNQQTNLPASTLLTPINDRLNSINTETITFSWNSNWTQSYETIANFHIYVYREAINTAYFAIAVPAYDASTSNSYFDSDAKTIFGNSVYFWRVITEDIRGKGIKSQTWGFKYSKSAGTLNIHTKYFNPVVSGNEILPFTNIDIETIGGGTTNPFPYLTTSTGTLSADFSEGTYRIKASKESFETVATTVSVTRNVATNLTVILKRSPSFMVGKVIDNNSMAVENATIKSVKPGDASIEKNAFTDYNGIFRVNVATNTSWNISVYKTGYSTSTVTSVNMPDYPSTANLGTITILKNNNTITGNVVNEGGYLITNAIVKVQLNAVEWTMLTDSNGYFSFKVSDGSWALTVTKTGFISPASVIITVSGGQASSRQLTLTSQSNRVTGKVTDNIQNIFNATVEAKTLSGQTENSSQTDIYGQYSLNLRGGNTYILSASKAGYTPPPSQQITFTPQDSGITVSGIDFVLTPNQSYIKGKVTTDGITPLEDATVTDGNSTSLTDTAGNYTLNVAEGDHIVQAIKQGYTSNPQQQHIIVSVGETISGVNFTLSPNASMISGTVYDNSGNKIYQAQVTASTSPAGTNPLYSVSSDINGLFTFNLVAGKWYVKASKQGYLNSQAASVTVAPGQSSNGNDLSIISNIGYLSGIIKSSNTYLRDVAVKIYRNGQLFQATVTDTNGAYLFAVEPGSYTLSAEKTGYKTFVSASIHTVIFSSETRIPDITLDKTVYFIEGIVSGPLGTLVKDANVTAGEFSTLTDINGYYRISVNEGAYLVFTAKKGYISLTSTQTVRFNSQSDPEGTVKTANFNLNYNYGAVRGSVLVQDTGAAIGGAQVNANGHIVVSAADGSYSLASLIPGTYDISASSQGFITVSTQAMVNDGQTLTVNFALPQALYSASGRVRNTSLQPLENTTVRARNSVISQTAITNTNGIFSVNNLNNGTYAVDVIKTGYSFLSGPDTITINNASVSGLDYILQLSSDTIGVNVLDNETMLPVPAAYVTAEGETPQTAGYYGEAYTGADGSCAITNLKPGTYTLQITKTNYKLKITTGVFTVSNNIYILERNYGSISGRVTKDGAGLEGVTIKAVSTSGRHTDTSCLTLIDGIYILDKLFEDTYLVSAVKDEHYSTPASAQVTVTASSFTASNITGIDFDLVYSSIVTLEISPPQTDIISNLNEAYQFSLIAKDKDGRPVSFSTSLWSVSPVISGSISQGGLYTPQNNFLGKISISASAANRVVTSGNIVYYKLLPLDSDTELQGNDGFKLMMTRLVTKHPSMLDDKITLNTSGVEQNRIASDAYTVRSKVYNLKPDSFMFSNAVKLGIPVPGASGKLSSVIGLWDNSKLKWTPLATLINGNYAETDTDHFSEYAVLSQAGVLALDVYEAMPNPFSPRKKPISIKYFLNSDSGSKVSVTIGIYNMNGEQVKILKESELQSISTTQEITWDGTNNDGEDCLNGRYIVYFTVEDATGKRSVAKTVVLIK